MVLPYAFQIIFLPCMVLATAENLHFQVSQTITFFEAHTVFLIEATGSQARETAETFLR